MLRLLSSLFLFLLACSALPDYTRQPTLEDHMFAMNQKTVQIMSYCDGELQGWGSGVVLNDHEVVTAWHVADESCELAIKKSTVELPAYIKTIDKKHDLVLLTGEFYDVVGTVLNTYPALGSEVICFGYPFEDMTDKAEFTVSKGTLIKRDLFWRETYFHRVDAIIYFGNSGGPCFDYQGRLVGIADRLNTSLDGAGYIVSAYHVRDLLKQ